MFVLCLGCASVCVCVRMLGGCVRYFFAVIFVAFEMRCSHRLIILRFVVLCYVMLFIDLYVVVCVFTCHFRNDLYDLGVRLSLEDSCL